jgi:hypothetical protein
VTSCVRDDGACVRRRRRQVLSANASWSTTIEELQEGLDYQARATREELSELAGAMGLSERIGACVGAALLARGGGIGAAASPPPPLDVVELFGGCGRVPVVAAAVADALSRAGYPAGFAPVGRSLNGAEAVARGAALHGAIQAAGAHRPARALRVCQRTARDMVISLRRRRRRPEVEGAGGAVPQPLPPQQQEEEEEEEEERVLVELPAGTPLPRPLPVGALVQWGDEPGVAAAAAGAAGGSPGGARGAQGWGAVAVKIDYQLCSSRPPPPADHHHHHHRHHGADSALPLVYSVLPLPPPSPDDEDDGELVVELAVTGPHGELAVVGPRGRDGQPRLRLIPHHPPPAAAPPEPAHAVAPPSSAAASSSSSSSSSSGTGATIDSAATQFDVAAAVAQEIQMAAHDRSVR